MGTKKPKRINKFHRNKPTREPYDVILIVCEGEQTEPNYFNNIVSYHRLSSANVEITAECGTDPHSIVNYAKELYQKSKRKGVAYDKVYCVFDKDTHANFEEARNKIHQLKPNNVFHDAVSIPCFEFWFLLHFKYSDMPLNSDQALRKLKKEDKNYKKNENDWYEKNIDKRDDAISNAKRLHKNSDATNSPNPYTNVHELVEYLINIKCSDSG